MLDCQIIYTVLIIEHNGGGRGLPHLKRDIHTYLRTFIKQMAAEQNSHQHSNYRICYFLSFFPPQRLTFIKLCMSADVLYEHGKWRLILGEEIGAMCLRPGCWRDYLDVKYFKVSAVKGGGGLHFRPFFFTVALRPNAGHGLLIHEVF